MSLYTAFDRATLPTNPLPFLAELAEYVRIHGTAAVRHDDAKRLLWVVMAQAYGELATVDMSEEWTRLVIPDNTRRTDP